LERGAGAGARPGTLMLAEARERVKRRQAFGSWLYAVAVRHPVRAGLKPGPYDEKRVCSLCDPALIRSPWAMGDGTTTFIGASARRSST